jgi:hypothetical protein
MLKLLLKDRRDDLTATCRIVYLVNSEFEFGSHNGARQVLGKAAGMVSYSISRTWLAAGFWNLSGRV